jgi:hypothetical protein
MKTPEQRELEQERNRVFAASFTFSADPALSSMSFGNMSRFRMVKSTTWTVSPRSETMTPPSS